jgi:glycosyltransferase involved in cell wall biosynthesis
VKHSATNPGRPQDGFTVFPGEVVGPRIAIIVPACNEEACIGPILEELLRAIDPAKYLVAVGVNDSSDRTAQIAGRYPVCVAETGARGYGYGCRAAIDAVTRVAPGVSAFVFFAADGASDPQDIAQLAAAHEQGYAMVMGSRTTRQRNWRAMTLPHVLANFALGFWCGLLTGRRFYDLGPLRLIERRLFEALAPEEMTFGWTIEAQVGAAMLGAQICEVPAHERRRRAGEQKVSGVTWRRTFSIGCRIFAAGWRARKRFARMRRNSQYESRSVVAKARNAA